MTSKLTSTKQTVAHCYNFLKEDVFFRKFLAWKTNNGGDAIGAAEWANYLQSDTQPAFVPKNSNVKSHFLSLLCPDSKKKQKGSPVCSLDWLINYAYSIVTCFFQHLKCQWPASCDRIFQIIIFKSIRRTKLAVGAFDNDIKEIILKSARSVVPRSMRSVAWSARVSHASLKLKPNR